MRGQADELRQETEMAHATNFGPFGPDGKRRYMQWNPEITFGNVVAIAMGAIAGLGAFYNLKEAQSNQQLQIAALQKADAEIQQRGQDRSNELKSEVKELKQAIYDLQLQVARGANYAPVPQQSVTPRFVVPPGR